MPSRTEIGARSSDDELAARLGDLVARLARRLRRASRKTLLPFELSDGQARTLRIVASEGAPLRMSEIARRIEVVPRSATTVVEVLEERGLVAREMDPDDRRSVRVRLTAKGSQLFARLDHARDEEAVALFGRIDTGDRRELLRLLSALELSAEDEDGDGSTAGRDRRRSAHGSLSDNTKADPSR